MDATSGIALVLQLARDGASLLEGAVACKRQAARLQRALSQFASRLEQLRETDVNVAQLEAELRSLLVLLKPYFGDTARIGLAAKTLLLFQVKAIRQALAKAGQHLQTCLQLCQLDRQSGQLRELWQGRTAVRLAEEAKDDEDARNELLRLLETLQRRGLLNSASEKILSLLQKNPDMDAGALFEGQLGTRRQRRALGRLTISLARAEEVEAASLGRDQVFIKSPLQVLGEGQFGQVILGVLRRDDGSEVETAIKRVNPDGRGMQFWEQQALMREAASLNGLRHANIVCLLGTCILQNRFHLVMDKCDMSLYDLLYQGEADAMSALTLDDKEAILRGIARGLDYLHSKLVLHRDLKPANILLNHNLGLVKLADFGLATQLESNSSVADTVSFAGTPVYMAPEVLQVPARWTTRADVYAFGIVMWEVYHGRSPFTRVLSITDLQTRVLNGERPTISDEIVVRPWVVPLIQRCWEHDPENRPLASELLKIFEGRKNVRRSARLIRGMVSVFSRRRSGRNVAESMSTELVQSLAREVSQKSDRLSQALEALREILEQEYHAGEGDVVRADVRSRGIILSMKRLLEHDTDVDILTKALWVLRFALSGSTGRPFRMAAVHSHGLGKIVINMFQAFREHEDLQGAACGFVMVVANASDANGVSLVQDMKAGDEIVAAMRAHRTSDTVQTEACGALWHLAENIARNMEILGQELRVGRDIVGAMRSHPGSRTVQANACGALWALAIDSNNRVILGQRLRVGSYIVAAMRAHRTSVKVQQNACKSLWKLAGDTNNRVILGQTLNAGQAVVAAMRRHPTNEGVQNFACSALSDLAGNARNRAILGQELNAGEVIVAAMCAHPRSAIVREKACAALSALAMDGRNKVILGQELKVGKEIAKAMREHRTREGVQKNACRAIGALALDNRNREILAQEVKIGEQIVVAMRSHAAKKVVQTHACEAICSLALNERNRVIFGQELNVGKYIAEAMRTHRRCERVQQEACLALQILAINDRNETIFAQECKVGKEIAAAMRANCADAAVQENACGALWNLSFKSRNKTILGQEVMVGKEIVMAMRMHPWSEGLQKKACGALRNLALDLTVRSVLRRQGAVQAVQRTCQRFPSLQTAKEARSRLTCGDV